MTGWFLVRVFSEFICLQQMCNPVIKWNVSYSWSNLDVIVPTVPWFGQPVNTADTLQISVTTAFTLSDCYLSKSEGAKSAWHLSLTEDLQIPSFTLPFFHWHQCGVEAGSVEGAGQDNWHVRLLWCCFAQFSINASIKRKPFNIHPQIGNFKCNHFAVQKPEIEILT